MGRNATKSKRARSDSGRAGYGKKGNSAANHAAPSMGCGEDAERESATHAATDEGERGAAQRHISVLLEEVLSFLEPKPGLRILDATLGMGGHSEALLRKCAEAKVTDAALLGLDKDTEALGLARERLAPFGTAVTLRHSPFSECDEVLDEIGWETVDFALADIGVSSLQLDEAQRGFSYAHDGPLDMRMDATKGKSAAALVNEAPVTRLKEIIQNYGEDPMAGKIARAIDDARAQKTIETTRELAAIIERAYPPKWRAHARNHPATRAFQAFRMAVNDELGELERFLAAITKRLAPGGRVAVITFHSLEDRIVKHFFRAEATGCRCPKYVPVCVCGHEAALTVLTRKPVLPSENEARINPRAGSAKLRVAEKNSPAGHESAAASAMRRDSRV